MQPAAEDVVDALLDCHAQIRQMMRTARRLALSGPRAFSELREAAEAVRTFCIEALPRHEADEHLVLVRLAGHNAELDEVLAQLASEHEATAAELARLVALCDTIECDPRELSTHSSELSGLAARLEATFTAHLELEERELFPAIRALPPAAQDEIRRELRAGRE